MHPSEKGRGEELVAVAKGNAQAETSLINVSVQVVASATWIRGKRSSISLNSQRA
jgi:hypothetical protein